MAPFIRTLNRMIVMMQEAAYNSLLYAHRTKIHWAALALVHEQLGPSLHNRSLFLHHWRHILPEEDLSLGATYNLSLPDVVNVLLRSGQMVRGFFGLRFVFF